MLGNIGPLEILVVLIIALVVFGPKRLPELGNSLGRGIREFRDSVSGEKHDEDADERQPAGALQPPRRAASRGAARARGRLRQAEPEGRIGMTRRVKAVSHEDRLTLVEHLDELRSRLIVSLVDIRRRPGALLLAEPPAARNRLRAAAQQSQEAAHLRSHRAFHDDADGGRLRSDHPLAAVRPLRALRLRAARLQPGRAPGRSCRSSCSPRSSSSPGSPSPTSP